MLCSSPERTRSKVIEYPGACLAGEGVRHPDILDNLRLVVPELIAISAVDLRHDELDVLGNQFALLPRHRLASLITSPHLCAARRVFDLIESSRAQPVCRRRPSPRE